MDLSNLSSNWKKLQEKLKKDSCTTKRKISAVDGGADPAGKHNAKRIRADKTKDVASSRRQKASKATTRRSMDKEDKQERKDGLTRRDSTTSVQEEKPRARVNEGLSPTYVLHFTGVKGGGYEWCDLTYFFFYRAEIGKYIAIDCEMVGVGPEPDKDSALARVSIVNWHGEQVYDSFVRPKEKVTDWRTPVSGITPKDMVHARSLEEVQRDVAKILDGTILIGHAVRNDLDALLLSHPKCDIRDTSKYPPYRKVAGGGTPRLKILAAEFLGIKIQEGAHSSVEDARTAMMLYRRDKEGFEREHAKKWPVRPSTNDGSGQQKTKKKKKKKNRKR